MSVDLETLLMGSGDKIEVALVKQAKTLVEQLEHGDSTAAMMTINELYQKRDYGLYQEIGKLTRNIHDAIKNFQIDIADVHSRSIEKGGGNKSRMNDASDRLNYVIQLTENAANRTMDMVEDTIPISKELGDTAKNLQEAWQRMVTRKISSDEFRQLYKDMDGFLTFANDKANSIDANLSSILIAQDYQDLTGQVIKRVIQLVGEVESSLVSLVKASANVEMITGISHDLSYDEVRECPIKAEGPVMRAEERDDVVHGQGEVDDLLSSLGF